MENLVVIIIIIKKKGHKILLLLKKKIEKRGNIKTMYKICCKEGIKECNMELS